MRFRSWCATFVCVATAGHALPRACLLGWPGRGARGPAVARSLGWPAAVFGRRSPTQRRLGRGRPERRNAGACPRRCPARALSNRRLRCLVTVSSVWVRSSKPSPFLVCLARGRGAQGPTVARCLPAKSGTLRRSRGGLDSGVFWGLGSSALGYAALTQAVEARSGSGVEARPRGWEGAWRRLRRTRLNGGRCRSFREQEATSRREARPCRTDMAVEHCGRPGDSGIGLPCNIQGEAMPAAASSAGEGCLHRGVYKRGIRGFGRPRPWAS